MTENHLIEERMQAIRKLLAEVASEEADALALVALGLVETLIRKNADYGASTEKRPRLAKHLTPADALLTRIEDKLNRLETLLDRQQAPRVNESLAETWFDLAGYCLLMVRHRQRGG